MESIVPNRLTTLGHPQRLAVFRLLMRRYPDRIPATEIAQALGLKPNTLSAYVNALMQAGLVTRQRAGTSLLYSIDMEAVRGTFDYLLLDCCRGRPEICMSPAYAAPAAAERPAADRKINVLFICTGNSARSIFAEAILRKHAGDRFGAFSAGTRPRAAVNPFAHAVLERKGHDVSALFPQDITDFQGPEAPRFDFVITLCNDAANAECAAWPGQPVYAHWGMPDPMAAIGADAEKSMAFQATYGAVRDRIIAFAALPLPTLDKGALQQAVDDIGQIGTREFA